MDNLLTKYFHDTDENINVFNPPATDDQIERSERLLKTSLPASYKEFLKLTNGFEGLVNDFVVQFEPVNKIHHSTQINCSSSFPWAIFIGSNGGGEMFIIDKRSIPYQFGLLPFISDENDFLPLGDTFERFIARLYNDNAFKKI